MKKQITLLAILISFVLMYGNTLAFPLGTTVTYPPSILDWDYLERVDFYEIGGISDGYRIGESEYYPGSMNYSHLLPGEFNSETCNVTAAYMLINASWIDECGNEVIVEGEWQGNLNHTWSWIFYTPNTIFDLTDLPSEVWEGEQLDILINAGEYKLKINHSIFAMSYECQGIPIPEPLTICMVGLGLVGIAYTRRKK
jgi:hypothetical protein